MEPRAVWRSGCQTVGMKAMRARRRTAPHGTRPIAANMFCAAVPGWMMRADCARRVASIMRALCAIVDTGFGLLARRRLEPIVGLLIPRACCNMVTARPSKGCYVLGTKNGSARSGDSCHPVASEAPDRRAHADREALWAVNSAVRFAGAPQSEHPSKSPTMPRSYAEGAATQLVPGLSSRSEQNKRFWPRVPVYNIWAA